MKSVRAPQVSAMKSVLSFLLCVGTLAQALPPQAEKNVLRFGYNPRMPNGGKIAGDGGTDAAIGQFPWQASVTMDDALFCAGSLLSEHWVLTAGQCVVGVETFVIVLGTLAPGPLGDDDSVRVTSRTSVLHPSFTTSPLVNDIALIAVEYPGSQWTSRIAPVRLPKHAQAGELFVNEAAVIAGWGVSDDVSAPPAPALRYANATVVDITFCLETYGGWLPVDTVICALGGSAASICVGDAGDPLLVSDFDGSLVQVGVASFGVTGGCARNYPQSYTRVTAFLDWLAGHGVLIEDF